jgi:DNA primase
LHLADASKLVEEAHKRIWKPQGKHALDYLRSRGLSDETIKAARLGWTPGVSVPIRDGTRYWRVSGIVVPWVDGDRLQLVKIRRPERREPKYVEAFRDQPMLFPAPEAVRTGKPLVIVEGEFDALLLGHALGELAGVVTLGSASSKPEQATCLAMLAAPAWYVAHDGDGAGDNAAAGWVSARAHRVRPPGAYKDWTEAAQGGINLRRWWSDRLGGIEAPALFIWEELAAMRWGPAVGDPTPGIVIDGPSKLSKASGGGLDVSEG